MIVVRLYGQFHVRIDEENIYINGINTTIPPSSTSNEIMKLDIFFFNLIIMHPPVTCYKLNTCKYHNTNHKKQRYCTRISHILLLESCFINIHGNGTCSIHWLSLCHEHRNIKCFQLCDHIHDQIQKNRWG